MSTITIPDMDFAGFYYPEILERLILYKRQNVPELTDESEYEPFMQLLAMFALVGHQNNVLIDLVANESTLPTARLVETVRNMLRLIDYEMLPASPSQAVMFYVLSQQLNSTVVVVPDKAQVSTVRTDETDEIYFEADEAISCERTDRFGAVYVQEAGAFSDYTLAAAGLGGQVQGWTSPEVGDEIYFGHANALFWYMFVFVISEAVDISGVWEWYDGVWQKIAPTSVTDLGGSLEIDLTSYLGTADRTGSVVRVTLNETGAYEELTSTYSGGVNKITTTGYLGQSSPSTDPDDYSVGSEWQILPADDGTNGFKNDDTNEVSWSPDLVLAYLGAFWTKTTVNGYEGYFVRFRITEVGGAPSGFTSDHIWPNSQFISVMGTSTQGRTHTDDPLGSSDGTANQRFESTKDYFIWGSDTAYVDDEPWSRVDSFLSSGAQDKHYRVELGENDRATFIFGDGVNGRIPPTGVNNIKAVYRYGANLDGNVGNSTITEDKQGLTYVSQLYNIGNASGWSEAQGANETTLEQAKYLGPASLRVGEVALSPDDLVVLTRTYTNDAGTTPFARAKAFEETYGPKTVELVVVPQGGYPPATTPQLEALQEYFNGDQFVYPPKPKRFVANQEVTAVNYTYKLIDVVATVYGDSETLKTLVENRLAAVLHPTALADDGIAYEWEFGADVPVSRLIHEIFETSEEITKVEITTPAADVPLTPRELPVLGTATITVVTP